MCFCPRSSVFAWSNSNTSTLVSRKRNIFVTLEGQERVLLARGRFCLATPATLAGWPHQTRADGRRKEGGKPFSFHWIYSFTLWKPNGTNFGHPPFLPYLHSFLPFFGNRGMLLCKHLNVTCRGGTNLIQALRNIQQGALPVTYSFH